MARLVRRTARTLADVFVFAPAGFLIEAPHLVPELIETGRGRLAGVPGFRALGALGTTRRRDEEGKRSGRARRVRPRRRAVETEPDGPVSTSDSRTDVASSTEGLDLPIPGYDQLAASQIVARLGDLDQADLGVVQQYEQTHRARRTVLNKIAQLQKA
jgi:hypothetical protein